MLFFYFPVDEYRTERVSMGHVTACDADDEGREIAVLVGGEWFTLLRHPIADGWTCRIEFGVVDAELSPA